MIKTKEKKSIFWPVILSACAVFLLLLGVGLWVLWDFLEDYQETLPQTVAAPMADAVKTSDGAALLPYCGELPAALSNEEKLSVYLRQRLQNHTVDVYMDESFETERPVYAVAANGEPVALVTLKRTEQKSKYGFNVLEIDSVALCSDTVYTVTAPKGVELLLDGAPLPPSYVKTETPIEHFAGLQDNIPQSVAAVSSGFAYLDEVTARNPWGGQAETLWDGNKKYAEVVCRPTQETCKLLGELALGFVRDYAHFVSEREAPRDVLLGRMYPGTRLWKDVWSYDNTWGMVSKSEQYDNEKVEDFRQYAPEEYSCVVSMDYTVTYWGNEKNLPLSYTCFITNRGGLIRIVDLKSGR